MSGAESGQVSDQRVFRQIHRYGGGEVDTSRWPANDIGGNLWAERGPGYPAWTYFLRADTMHGLYTSWRQFLTRPESFLRHLLDQAHA